MDISNDEAWMLLGICDFYEKHNSWAPNDKVYQVFKLRLAEQFPKEADLFLREIKRHGTETEVRNS